MENSLKLTIVGAGSPYTPELLEQAKNYEDRLPIREIVLYDIDSHRLEIMEAFCNRFAEELKLPVTIKSSTCLKAALEGDPVAKDIWTKTGKRMAQCMTARIRKMHMEYEPVEVVLSGSVFKCRAPQLIESVTGEILDCNFFLWADVWSSVGIQGL